MKDQMLAFLNRRTTKTNREEKARDQDEINRLRDAVAFKERECQDNDAKIKSVDYDLYKA